MTPSNKKNCDIMMNIKSIKCIFQLLSTIFQIPIVKDSNFGLVKGNTAVSLLILEKVL